MSQVKSSLEIIAVEMQKLAKLDQSELEPHADSFHKIVSACWDFTSPGFATGNPVHDRHLALIGLTEIEQGAEMEFSTATN